MHLCKWTSFSSCPQSIVSSRDLILKVEFFKQNFSTFLKWSWGTFLIHLSSIIRINNTCTCIFWRLVETSLIFWGISKHLAVVIFALTSHCWKSLKALRNLCCNICSLFWQPLDACRQRLNPWLEVFHGREETIQETKIMFDRITDS